MVTTFRDFSDNLLKNFAFIFEQNCPIQIFGISVCRIDLISYSLIIIKVQ
jgi:hypothetical protein